jgi:hypothetical protein
VFLWPLVWIRVRDPSSVFSLKKTENLDLIFPLIKYVDFLDSGSKEDSLKKLYQAYKIKFSDLESESTIPEIDKNDIENSEEDSESSEEEHSSEEKDKNEVEADAEEEESEEEKSNDKNSDRPIKVTTKETQEDEHNLKIEDHRLYEQYQKRIKDIPLLDLESRIKDKAFNKMYGENFIDSSEKIFLEVNGTDKEYEDDVRQRQLDILRLQKDELNETLIKCKTDYLKRKKRGHLIANRKRIEELENEAMDEEKFWNYMNDDNDFEYGRSVLTDTTLEKIIKCPYSKLELKTMPELIFDELDQIDPRIPSDDGNPKRFLKAKIVVKDLNQKKDENDADKKKLDDLDDQDGDEAYITPDIAKIAALFPFNITMDEFMKKIIEPEHFVCRVYVLR